MLRLALAVTAFLALGAAGTPPPDSGIPDPPPPDPPSSSYDLFWPGLGAMQGIDWTGVDTPIDWPGI